MVPDIPIPVHARHDLAAATVNHSDGKGMVNDRADGDVCSAERMSIMPLVFCGHNLNGKEISQPRERFTPILPYLTLAPWVIPNWTVP